MTGTGTTDVSDLDAGLVDMEAAVDHLHHGRVDHLGEYTHGWYGQATNFANSVYTLMQTYGFDGFDIDLETCGRRARRTRADAGLPAPRVADPGRFRVS